MRSRLFRSRPRWSSIAEASSRPGWRSVVSHTSLGAGRARHAAIAVQQENPVSVMNPYIGTPTSRIDGRAKVTGAAQYAGEFNVPGLSYASVVASTISRGRIARIDVARALAV